MGLNMGRRGDNIGGIMLSSERDAVLASIQSSWWAKHVRWEWAKRIVFERFVRKARQAR